MRDLDICNICKELFSEIKLDICNIVAELSTKVNDDLVPVQCYRKKLRGYCRSKRLRKPECYIKHIITCLSEYDKIESRYNGTIFRLIRRCCDLLDLRKPLEDKLIKMLPQLCIVFHDFGKLARIYQIKKLDRKFDYKHEIVSGYVVYKFLRGVFNLNRILSAHLALAVLLHHSYRIERLLCDLNCYMIKPSWIDITFRSREEYLTFDRALIEIQLKLLNKHLGVTLRLEDFITAVGFIDLGDVIKIDINDLVKTISDIQILHIGLPRDDIRRAFRMLSALFLHIVQLCDNRAAYKNRAPEEACRRCQGITKLTKLLTIQRMVA